MKEFKKPDVKAPRFRPEVYNVLNKEFFDLFRKKYPRYKNMDNDSLKKIAKTFNRYIFQTVIDTRDGVQLPESLGWIFIGTCQQSKKNNIDFSKSVKYGVTVSNKNWETDGKLAKIFFTNLAPKHRVRNREFWSFRACRDFKRSVAKTYPENWNMYVRLDPLSKLETIYRKVQYKDYIKKETEKALKTYNEFDI
jgi:hypothetical protein